MKLKSHIGWSIVWSVVLAPLFGSAFGLSWTVVLAYVCGSVASAAAAVIEIRSRVSSPRERRVVAKPRTERPYEPQDAQTRQVPMRPSHTLIAHMGDSRAYLMHRGALQQLTSDHSLVQVLIDAGRLTRKNAGDGATTDELLCYVGMPGEPLPDVGEQTLEHGDRLMLCSDRLTSVLSDHDLRSILLNEMPFDAIRHSLGDLANARGERDNIGLVIISA